MTVLAQTLLSLADVQKRQNPKGGVGDILEIMNQANTPAKDAMFLPCNKGTTHLNTIRTGLPSLAWGELYKGVPQSKSSTQQVEDVTGFVEASCQVDQRLLELYGDNGAALRRSEAMPFLEAMMQECATSLFYHSHKTDPKKPTGLAARMGELATSGAGNQIVDAGGTGSDNTSIWFVTWGSDAVHGIYPANAPAGLQQKNRGEQRVTDGNGDPYFVEQEDFSWHIGWVLRDYRRVSRIANIDVSDLQGGSVDIYKWMRKAYYKLHNRRIGNVDGQHGLGRTMIYCNRDVLEALDAAGTNAGASDNFVRLRPMELQGEEVLSYRGMPIRETDALLNTEARVV